MFRTTPGLLNLPVRAQFVSNLHSTHGISRGKGGVLIAENSLNNRHPAHLSSQCRGSSFGQKYVQLGEVDYERQCIIIIVYEDNLDGEAKIEKNRITMT